MVQLLNRNTHDDYYTPKSAWENILKLLPKGTAWECFVGKSDSGKYLEELGVKCYYREGEDFFKTDCKGDYILSNPPYNYKILKPILKRIKKDQIPFILIMPQNKLNSKYFIELFQNEIQLIIPKKRINFKKVDSDGNTLIDFFKSKSSFDCYYYCYKMNFKKDLQWI